MALSLSSPGGCTYDEDEEIAVFESTAAEHGGLARPRLPELSVISPGLDTQPSIIQPVRVCYFYVLPCGVFIVNKLGDINQQNLSLK